MLGSRGLGGVQRNLLPLLGLGSVSDYCGALLVRGSLCCPACDAPCCIVIFTPPLLV